MTARVRLRPEAEADVEEAIAWYEGHEAGLGGRFLAALRESRTLLAEHPESGQLVAAGIRRVLVPGFPYSLIYVEGAEIVIIVACFHFRRDPKGWRERLRTE